jgi:hypothetical protein
MPEGTRFMGFTGYFPLEDKSLYSTKGSIA